MPVLGRGLFDCNTMRLLRSITGQQRSATGYGILNLAGCLAGGLPAAAAGCVSARVSRKAENLSLHATPHLLAR